MRARALPEYRPPSLTVFGKMVDMTASGSAGPCETKANGSCANHSHQVSGFQPLKQRP